MINSDIEKQIQNIINAEIPLEQNPFETVPAPVGTNIVDSDINSLLALAKTTLEESKPKTTRPAVENNKVVKLVTAQVIGDDRVWEPQNIVAYEVARIHEFFDYVETDDELRVIFTPENAKWKKPGNNTYGSVLMCAYDATRKYLQNMLGVGLDTADATWYRQHPLTESQGLPEAHTLTVLSDLVKPFGLGISHVYVKKGCSAYEEQIAWQAALGINPEAMIDRNKSNAEFIADLGLEGESLEFMKNQAKTWRFEYVDQLPSPCIGMSGSAIPVGAAIGGGHTTYYGPREVCRNFKMGLRYDRLENIKYHAEVPTYESSISTEPELELDFYQCLSNNGKPIGSCSNSYYGPNHNTGPKGWSNSNTAQQFEKPAPSNVLKIGEQKKRIHNHANRKRRDERGDIKTNNYSRFNAEEKERFSAFSMEFAGCTPDKLGVHELQANYETSSQVCELLLDTYHKRKINEMYQMSGIDNWENLESDTMFGSKFRAAKSEAIEAITPFINLLTIVDLYLMLKACKAGNFRSFMLSIINYIIYEEPSIADQERDQLEENSRSLSEQGIDLVTGDCNVVSGSELTYEEIMQQNQSSSSMPNHNSRLQAMLMEAHQRSGQDRSFYVPEYFEGMAFD